MQILFFLPSFLYGLFLAAQGDPLLLLLTVSAVGIWAIPLLPKRSGVVKEQEVLELKPPPGAIIDQNGAVFELPSEDGISIWQLIGDPADAKRLFVSLAEVADQECWVWSKTSIENSAFMRSISSNCAPSEKKEFVSSFLSRATIPLDLNLMVEDVNDAELEPVLRTAISRSPIHSFRLITLSTLFSGQSEKVRFERSKGVFILQGEKLSGGNTLRLLDTAKLEEPQLSKPNTAGLALEDRLRLLGHGQDS